MATASTSSVKSVAAGTKISSIGTVKSIVGTVTATDANGVTRTLQVGDKVFTNDVIQTSAAGAILIEFINGSHMDLGRDSKLALDLDVFNPNVVAEGQADIASVQALIAAGADPTQITEASAAGPTGAGGADGEGASFVVVDQAAPQGLVTSGFPTGPISTAFEQPTGELPFVEPEPAIPTNTPPTVGSGSATVSEEGLPERGIPDDVGVNDTTDDIVATGQVPVGDADGNPLTVTLTAPTDPLASGGQPITWSGSGAVGDPLVGSIVVGEGESIPIIEIEIDSSGNYEVRLLGPIDHLDGSVEDDLSFTVGVNVSDGLETVTGSLVITVEDDSPIVTSFDFNEETTLVLDESVGTGGSTKDESGNAVNNDEEAEGAAEDAIGYATISGDDLFSLTVAPGADGLDTGATTYQLTLALAEGETEVDSGLDATGGGDIMLSQELATGDIVGMDGTTEVFRIHIDSSSGDVTVTQFAAIDHGDDDNDHDAALAIGEGLVGATVTVYDMDGDSDTSDAIDLGSLVSFEDDGPAFNSVMDAVLSSATKVVFTGNYDADFGSDGLDYLSVALGATGKYQDQDVNFAQSDTSNPDVTKVDVNTTGNNPDTLLTFYYTVETDPVSAGGDGTVTFYAFGDEDMTEPFFTLTVNPDGTYKFDISANTLLTEIEVTGSDFTAAGPSGSRATADGSLTIYGDDEDADTTFDDAVNSSNLGVGIGQPTIDEGEALHLDFAIQQTRSVSFKLVQWGGSGTVQVGIIIDGVRYDFNEATATVDNLTFTKPTGNSKDVTIEIMVVDPGDPLAGNLDYNAATKTYTLYVDDPFDSVIVENMVTNAGGVQFGLNNFTYDISSIQDLTVNFDLSVTDGDGDVATLNDQLTIDLLNPSEDVTVTSDPDIDEMPGVVLVGNGENDILVGGAGDDILIGDKLADTMTGGDGSDTFVFNADSFTNPANDTITDFHRGNNNPADLIADDPNADVLDISDVLVAAHASDADIPADLAAAISGGFLTVVPVDSNTAQIVLDLDGTGGNDPATTGIPIVTLDNLSAGYDAGTLLTTLLNDGQLK